MTFRLLDLFSCQGGTARGYLAAGMTMSDRAGRAAVRLERLQRRMPRMRQTG